MTDQNEAIESRGSFAHNIHKRKQKKGIFEYEMNEKRSNGGEQVRWRMWKRVLCQRAKRIDRWLTWEWRHVFPPILHCAHISSKKLFSFPSKEYRTTETDHKHMWILFMSYKHCGTLFFRRLFKVKQTIFCWFFFQISFLSILLSFDEFYTQKEHLFEENEE